MDRVMEQERRSWSMETHGIALTALNRIDAHAEECVRRQNRIDASLDRLEKKIDTTSDLAKKVQIFAASVLGGLIVLGRIWDILVASHGKL